MINIKYFILLCATFYTTTVNSIREEDVVRLWDIIKTAKNDYIVYENFVIAYKGEEKDEFRAIIKHFGNHCEPCGVRRINFDQFREAALQGFIPLYPTAAMREQFDKTASKENALYITMKNLTDFYENDINYYPIPLVKTFGVIFEEEWRLYFDGYKKVLNFGLLPIRQV